MQADGSTKRNIQIDLRELRVPWEGQAKSTPLFVEGETRWSGGEVRDALTQAGLPDSSPISALGWSCCPNQTAALRTPSAGIWGRCASCARRRCRRWSEGAARSDHGA